jgi:hypothetical protein
MADSLDTANQSLYGPSQQGQTSLSPWRQMFPFSMDPGSTYGQGGGTGSMFAPNGQQGQQQQQPPLQQPPTNAGVPQPQYTLGPDGGEDAGAESKAFAGQLGQGVLAASQAAVKQQGGQKKKPGQPGQQQGGGDAGQGATPGSEGY